MVESNVDITQFESTGGNGQTEIMRDDKIHGMKAYSKGEEPALCGNDPSKRDPEEQDPTHLHQGHLPEGSCT